MARIKIELPTSFNFSCKIPVRITDVNYGGHLGNSALLSIIHEARMQFLKSLGLSEMDFGGIGLIMSDVEIAFKAEAFYGDVLEVFVAVNDVQKISFDIIYKLSKVYDEEHKTIAIAKTGMICYNYQLKKVSSIPNSIIPQLHNS